MDPTGSSAAVNNEPEDWRWISGYENFYAISTWGRVYSYRTRTFLAVGVDSSCGLPRLYLTTHSKTKAFLVHRVLLEAYRGPCPSGCHAVWLDGDRSNNRLSNLVWAPNQSKPSTRLSGSHTQAEALYGV